jgi:hypothetical protein
MITGVLEAFVKECKNLEAMFFLNPSVKYDGFFKDFKTTLPNASQSFYS